MKKHGAFRGGVFVRGARRSRVFTVKLLWTWTVFATLLNLKSVSGNLVSPDERSRMPGCDKHILPLATDIEGEYGGFAIWKNAEKESDSLFTSYIQKQFPEAFVWQDSFLSSKHDKTITDGEVGSVMSLLAEHTHPIRIRIAKSEAKQWEFYAIGLTFVKDSKETTYGVRLSQPDMSVTMKGMRPANSPNIMLSGTGLTSSALSYLPSWIRLILNGEGENANNNNREPTFMSLRHNTTTYSNSNEQNPRLASRDKHVCHISGVLQRLPNSHLDSTAPSDELHHFVRNPEIVGEIAFSSGCDTVQGSVSLALRMLRYSSLSSAYGYVSIVLAFKTAAEIGLVWWQLRSLESHNALFKSSPASVCLHILFDSFEGQFFFASQSKASDVSLFSSLALVGLEKIALVFILEVRWLILVWKIISTRAQMDAAGEVRTHRWLRDINSNIRWFFLFLIVSLVCLSSFFDVFPEVCILLFLFFIPQSIHNAYYGYRNVLAMPFVIGLSLCRFVLPWILWSNSIGLLPKQNHQPDPWDQSSDVWPGWFAGPSAPAVPTEFIDPVFGRLPRRPNQLALSIVIALLVLQVCYLHLQSVISPRIALPNWILVRLPAVFDYRQEVKRVVELKQTICPTSVGEECVICMTLVKFSDKECIVTPCEHFFHLLCLTRWMEVKMECPTCRGHLPQI